MKNLFTKKEVITVEEIHRAFDTAQDKLLTEANKILNETVRNDVAVRLKSLGFTKSKSVKDNEEKEIKIIMNTEIKDLVVHYTTEYPFLKFLQENQLDTICKRYGLIYAPVRNYTEDVPEKNVKEIEEAQELSRFDVRPLERWINIISFWRDAPQELRLFCKDNKIPYSGDIDTESSVKEAIIKAGYNGGFGEYIYDKVKIKTVDKSGLFICAPPSHFDLKGLEQQGLGNFKVETIILKDPVVFRYVKGGVQVLSKWGDEANDADLVVPNLN